jgi:hypothetical protein
MVMAVFGTFGSDAIFRFEHLDTLKIVQTTPDFWMQQHLGSIDGG